MKVFTILSNNCLGVIRQRIKHNTKKIEENTARLDGFSQQFPALQNPQNSYASKV